MGQGTFDRIPEYAAVESQVDAFLGYSVREMCASGPEAKLADTRFTQSCLFVVNALYYYDIRGTHGTPAAVAGHSLGEYNALLAAGAFDLLTGVMLVAERARLMATAPKGTMTAVLDLPSSEIARVLSEGKLGDLDVANYNAPTQTVISGLSDAMKRALPLLERAGARCVPLSVGAACHSRYMADIAGEYSRVLEACTFDALRIPVISNVTARPHLSSPAAIRSLLVEQLTRPVRWVESVRFLRGMGVTSLIEVGPGHVLTQLCKQIDSAPEVSPARLKRADAGTLEAKSRSTGSIGARRRELLRQLGIADLQSPAAPGAAQGNVGPRDIAPESPPRHLTLIPVWDDVQPELINGDSLAFRNLEHVVIVGGDETARQCVQAVYPGARIVPLRSSDSIDQQAATLRQHAPLGHVVWLAPAVAPPVLAAPSIVDQLHAVLACFRFVKALLAIGHTESPLAITAVTVKAQAVFVDEQISPALAGVHGFIGSVAKEYPNWQIRLVDLETLDTMPQDIARIGSDRHGNAWVHRNGRWFRQHLLRCEPIRARNAGFRRGGTYVIVGGAGGIGTVFSEYLARSYDARTVWIGRRPVDEQIKERIARVAKHGPAPIYVKADATDSCALQEARATIRARCGSVHGIVHSAIGEFDDSLLNVEEECFVDVLSAKITSSLRVAQIFRDDPLDFVLFFSSVAAFVRAAGMSGYAAGCTFQDAFAHQLAHKGNGIVRAMNWGYWGDVGVGARIPRAHRVRLNRSGVGVINAAQAMSSIETLLAGPFEQCLFLNATASDAERLGMSVEEEITAVQDHAPRVCERLSTELDDQPPRAMPAPDAAARRFDELVADLLWWQLTSLQLFAPGKRFNSPGATGYSRWLDESLRILATRGYLKASGDGYTVTRSDRGDAATTWREWDERRREWADNDALAACARLVDATLRAIPDIVNGKRPATDVIFPGGSMALVEDIYTGGGSIDYPTRVVASLVASYLAERCRNDPQARVRIVEVGAGTGATTSAILARLQNADAAVEEYCYTDISRAFLRHGEDRFRCRAPYLRSQVFDVERAPDDQAMNRGYDLVIASNVLHATRSMPRTLRNVKALLKTNGLLVVNEVVTKTLVQHLTFGLLEGWWLSEDPWLRIANSPLLETDTWDRVLRQEGFRAVRAILDAHELGQQVLVAESDGILRRYANVRPHTTNAHANPAAPSSPQARAEADHRTDEELRSYALTKLTATVARLFNCSADIIEPNEPLGAYGLDSILALQLAKELREAFPNLARTVFFEHQSIAALVEHFIATARDALQTFVGVSARDTQPAPTDAVARSDRSSDTPRGACEQRAPESAVSAVGEQHRRAVPQSPSTEYVPIAIVGTTLRCAEAEDVLQFWTNLSAGKDCITELPEARGALGRWFGAERARAGRQCRSHGGFVAGIDEFDANFFNVSPGDAAKIDPQQRLMLEAVWNLLESAGYTRRRLQEAYDGNVGVYVGATCQQYGGTSAESAGRSVPFTSCAAIANRVSYFFGLFGPSVAIDTMCSSSAAAVHLACSELARGDCDLAIAGGVNLLIDPERYQALNEAQLLTGDPTRRSFSDGHGFVPGEAVGAVLLKPLARARKDGDTILGVITGSASTSSGRSNGFGAPNPAAQRRLIEKTLNIARVDPRTISYVEAAASGASLADAAEVAALSDVFRGTAGECELCVIGSVKSNIGHAEAASGITQLIKVVQQLRHKQFVPSIMTVPLNPELRLESSPFRLQREIAPWKRPRLAIDGDEHEYPRRALVNSFGAAGSNVSLIIEEYIGDVVAEQRPSAGPIPEPHVMLFSAPDAVSLRAVVSRLLDYARSRGDIPLGDLAYTLQCGREPMRVRLGMLVRDHKELVRGMAAFMDSAEPPYNASRNGDAAPVVFSTVVECERSSLKELASGSEGAAIVGLLLSERRLEKLVLLWTHGVEVPWETLQRGPGARMIPLPTYPFRRQRYWWASDSHADAPQPTDAFADTPSPTDVPRTELEQTIVTVWQDVLGISVIGIFDTFMRLGGSSLNAKQVIGRLRQAFQVDVPIVAMLDPNTTVATLAVEVVSQLARQQSLPIVEEPRTAASQR
jgi:malonyl CoA-acyl carrier protein transacylase